MSKDVQPVTIVDSVNVRKEFVNKYLDLYSQLDICEYSSQNEENILNEMNKIFYCMNEEEIKDCILKLSHRSYSKGHQLLVDNMDKYENLLHLTGSFPQFGPKYTHSGPIYDASDYIKLYDEYVRIKDQITEERSDSILNILDEIFYKMNQEEINSLEKEFIRRENEKGHK